MDRQVLKKGQKVLQAGTMSQNHKVWGILCLLCLHQRIFLKINKIRLKK